MQLNGTSVLPRREAGLVSPVISGEGGWLGDDDRDQPLTARGTLARPEWLELCRRRVAEVTGCADTPAAALSPPATTTARAGAQPPSTTTFPRPRTPEETAPSEPGTRAEGLAHVRALTQIASPCRSGN